MAVSWRVFVRRNVSVDGVTVTLAAVSGVTVTATEALLPLATAEIVAPPTLTAITFPSAVTVATAVLLDENEIRLLRMEFPLQSKAVPTMAEVPFTGIARVAGATDTVQASGMGFRSRHPVSPTKTTAVAVARRSARLFTIGAATRMQLRPVNKSGWALRKGLPERDDEHRTRSERQP